MIVEGPIIKNQFDEGIIVAAAGGGGMPVVRGDADQSLQGVEAVIDKYLPSGRVGNESQSRCPADTHRCR